MGLSNKQKEQDIIFREKKTLSLNIPDTDVLGNGKTPDHRLLCS